MTKKRKNNRNKKEKKLNADVLKKRLISLISKQTSVRFDAKTAIQKLRITNSKDSVQSALEKLEQEGILKTTRSGKFKWNKKRFENRQSSTEKT